MTSPLKAYLIDADGARIPLHAHAIRVEFDSGMSIEMSLDARCDDPLRNGVLIWGGAVPQPTWTDDACEALTLQLGVRPLGGNVINVYPYRFESDPATGEVRVETTSKPEDD
ncbi:hypothetical protein [Pararobbsia silviterrae]|nr:hypothetical protein [Pararobbsia silviterrae]